MDQQHIEIEATRALNRLGCDLRDPFEVMTTVNVMQTASDAIDKEIDGERALGALIDLWRELKLREVTKESISVFLAAVDQLHKMADANLPSR